MITNHPFPKLREELEQFREDSKWTNTSIARALDISNATFSLWMNGEYRGKSGLVAKKISEFLKKQEDLKSAPKPIEFKMTTAAKKMFKFMTWAWNNQKFCVVVSRAGYGKTCSIDEYARQNSFIIVVQARPTQQIHMLLYELAEKVHCSVRNSSDMIYRRLVDKLKNTPKLLVFDEAQLYSYKTLEMIRRVYDNTNCGVILSGSYRLYDQMTGKGIKDYDQLYSRAIKRELPSLNQEDIRMLLEDKMNGELNHTNIKELLKLSTDSTRVLIKNLIPMAEDKAKGKPITMDLIREAHKHLMVA